MRSICVRDALLGPNSENVLNVSSAKLQLALPVNGLGRGMRIQT